MVVEIAVGTPLAEALNAAIQPKLVEMGWATSGGDDSGLAEYVVLMLVNGNTEDQIAKELAGDLLGLSPEDPGIVEFSRWLFERIDALNAQFNGGQAVAGNGNPADPDVDVGSTEMDTDMNANDVSELNAPTGPRSMRNGNHRGGREKRMLGSMNKAMDRSGDSVLHRVRGQTGSERINTHARGPPTGPRNARGGMNRNNNNRAASIQAGLAAGAQNGAWMMQGQQPSQVDLMAMLEQQNNMMFQLSQQLMSGGGGGNGGFGQQRRGKSLFDRVQDPHQKHRKGNHHNQAGGAGAGAGTEVNGEGEDVSMSGGNREASNPDETVCKYNLRCTNKDCKFAHQSPVAPPGSSIDVSDVCSFGAACKNRKCVGRHPSPAARLAHQNEQDCKFFPNCQNPQCPFRHPSMPLCRNGADCTTENCKFTHVKTKCKFNPCLNPKCAFAHDEGQQGGFKDKVWTAESGEHVSERKFINEGEAEEQVRAEEEGDVMATMATMATGQDTDVIT